MSEEEEEKIVTQEEIDQAQKNNDILQKKIDKSFESICDTTRIFFFIF